MKRLIIGALVAGLLAGTLLTTAGASTSKKRKKPPAKVEREFDFEYLCPCVGIYEFGTRTYQNIGGGPMPVEKNELYLTAEAVDLTGMVVPVEIDQDIDGDGSLEPVGAFCGKTEDPIAIEPGIEIVVYINAGFPLVCQPDNPTVLAGGTVHFVLSNFP